MLNEIRFFSATVVWVGLVAMLGGCATELDSPHYSAGFDVDLPGDSRPFPDTCLAIANGTNSPRLPVGCANALNLQRMVERPDDLRRGRDTGPSFAAPVAQAAERYLRGDNEDERERSRRLEQESSTGAP
ncbi:hypothetical protein MCB86_06675 [Pseudomonas sp. KSR10]|uniref:hypothetical protein n=1 Tax=Pseudomonas sp. KSR10 TaxID=2916654 RepID=UPI001EF8EC1D|nr:hypothetical protein [Pseudomonas sp. KSR10]MCG6539759.1 hypothetical protein [Pseudomonas sp. KSR10]